MNMTHPDDWEALEQDHADLSALLDPETNAESCCQLGLDIPSLTAWYQTIHTNNNSMIEETENIPANLVEARQVTDDLVTRVRLQSAQYADEHTGISHPYLVGYYESLIRRLAELPEVREILHKL